MVTLWLLLVYFCTCTIFFGYGQRDMSSLLVRENTSSREKIPAATYFDGVGENI